MRIFIGIETGSAQNELSGAANYIGTLSGGRPVRKSNIHLTVKFLGDVADTAPIISAMNSVCKKRRDFYLEMEDLVYMDRLKIAWCSVTGDTKALQMLHSDLEEALDAVGLQREKRPYLPHITLVRHVCKKWDIRDVRIEKKIFKVSKIILFESVSQNGELLYIPLHAAEFGDLHGG